MTAGLIALAAPAAAQDPVDPPRVLRSGLLIDLAQVMGASHYLKTVCEGRDEQYWRDRMVELLELEAAERIRLREAMIDAFNYGYRDHERRHRSCDSRAQTARDDMAERGAELARALGEPYL